jgi:hypothetical protein
VVLKHYRQNLAMIIAHPTPHDHTVLTHLGDALYTLGQCEAAQLCYLFAHHSPDALPVTLDGAGAWWGGVGMQLNAAAAGGAGAGAQGQGQATATGAAGPRVVLIGADHRRAPRTFFSAAGMALRRGGVSWVLW